jgi:lysyl-tRNA synthetase class I
MLNAQPTFTQTKGKQSKDLNAFLRDVMEPIDQLDLGLINRATYEEMCSNPIINVPSQQQLIDAFTEPKDYLKAIVEDMETFGIEYAGSLTAEEEVTDTELARALDTDDLNSIKE